MANRQEIVCTYIYENYVASGRLRHDVVSNKVQIRRPLPALPPLTRGSAFCLSTFGFSTKNLRFYLRMSKKSSTFAVVKVYSY